MCTGAEAWIIPAVVSAAGLGMQANAASRQAARQRQAQIAQMQDRNQQVMAQMNAARNQNEATAAANRMQMDLASQRGQKIQQAIQQFAQPQQEQKADELIGARKASQRQALEQSKATGGQTVGPKVAGEVSSKYTSGQATAAKESFQKALTRGDLLATIGGLKQLPGELGRQLPDIGTELTNASQQARGLAQASQFGIRAAGIPDYVPERYFDMNSSGAQWQDVLGKGLLLYGAYGAPGLNVKPVAYNYDVPLGESSGLWGSSPFGRG